MNQTDIAALHHFYSKHIDFPDDQALTVLFGQVTGEGAELTEGRGLMPVGPTFTSTTL